MCTVSPARKSVRSSTRVRDVRPVPRRRAAGRSGRARCPGPTTSARCRRRRPTRPPRSRPPSRLRSAGTCRQSQKRVRPLERAGGQRRLVGQLREARERRRRRWSPVASTRARAVGDRDPRAGDRRRRVERRHPDERRLLAPLEVHRQVRHEGRRRHVERAGRAGSARAEPRARQLDDVESRARRAGCRSPRRRGHWPAGAA